MQIQDLLLDIPADDYHAATRRGDYLSSHMLAEFRRSPLLYHRHMDGDIPERDSSAFLFGRAAHTLVLEGKAKFDASYKVSDGPLNDKTNEPYGTSTKAYKDWFAAQTLPVISNAEYAMMSAMRQSVRNHAEAASLLATGVAERTVRAVYCGEPCQIRMDWFRDFYAGAATICDLKTCCDLDGFVRDARKFGYAHQLAFYREVLRTASDGAIVADCYIIAIEKSEPRRSAVWRLTDALLNQAKAQNEDAISRLRTAKRTHTWPTGYEGLLTLDTADIMRRWEIDTTETSQEEGDE